MRTTLSEALKQAIKDQDKRRMSTLRLITAAIKDRDIALRASGREDGVDEGEILQILSKMIKQRRESVATYEEAGRLELAEQEAQEIEIISEFMPAQLSGDEMRAACKKVVVEVGASGLKDMGRVMARLKEQHPGAMDFARASAMVKELLCG